MEGADQIRSSSVAKLCRRTSSKLHCQTVCSLLLGRNACLSTWIDPPVYRHEGSAHFCWRKSRGWADDLESRSRRSKSSACIVGSHKRGRICDMGFFKWCGYSSFSKSTKSCAVLQRLFTDSGQWQFTFSVPSNGAWCAYIAVGRSTSSDMLGKLLTIVSKLLSLATALCMRAEDRCKLKPMLPTTQS